MDQQALSDALDRAEAALGSVERAVAQLNAGRGQDDALRQKVREAVAELDVLIRAANG